MTTFSANLGFLFTDRSLPEAIRAAKAAGFDAVECHFPFETSVDEVNSVLSDTGLTMLGLNTRRGDADHGENGLAAVAGREIDARELIDEALSYAVATNTQNVHVMAGIGRGATAHSTFVNNLLYATNSAGSSGTTILIEPLNKYDAPGYFLQTTEQALRIIEEVNVPNLKLMFDCYHVQLMEGNVTRRLAELLPVIGHIQFASVPDRGAPDRGELNYSHIFAELTALGYDKPLGAEYRPPGKTEESLEWLSNYRW